MNLTELLQIAAHRIRIEFLDRKEVFAREIAQIKEEMTLRGLLFSGMTVQRIEQAVRQEFEIRAMLAWQTISRVLSGQPLPVGDELIREIKGEVGRHLIEDCDDLETVYTSPIGRGDYSPSQPLDEVRRRVLDKVESEIDISLLAAARTAAPGTPTTITIYQSYAIVQTGPGSTALLAQHFGTNEREVISRALTAVEETIPSAVGIPSEERTQILELVVDARQELSKQQPNTLKLRGAISAIATSIQTLGSARAAYDLLKGAASLLGVHLP